jgi:hypothetical protein
MTRDDQQTAEEVDAYDYAGLRLRLRRCLRLWVFPKQIKGSGKLGDVWLTSNLVKSVWLTAQSGPGARLYRI